MELADWVPSSCLGGRLSPLPGVQLPLRRKPQARSTSTLTSQQPGEGPRTEEVKEQVLLALALKAEWAPL